jgi:hypothetical protein
MSLDGVALADRVAQGTVSLDEVRKSADGKTSLNKTSVTVSKEEVEYIEGLPKEGCEEAETGQTKESWIGQRRQWRRRRLLLDSSPCCITKYEPRETMYKKKPRNLGPEPCHAAQ